MNEQSEVREPVNEATERGSLPPSNGTSKPGLGDNHPLNDIMGTHEGPIWEQVLKNIRRNRKRADKEYLEQLES